MSDAPWFSSTMTNTCWMLVEVTLPSSWPDWVGIGSIGASSLGAAVPSSGSIGSEPSVAQPVNARTLLIAQTSRFMDSPPARHLSRVACALRGASVARTCLLLAGGDRICPLSKIFTIARSTATARVRGRTDRARGSSGAQSGRSGGALLARVHRPALDPSAHAEDLLGHARPHQLDDAIDLAGGGGAL